MLLTDRPPEFRLPMLQGAPLHKELPLAVHRITDAVYDLSDWTARLDLADEDGTVILTFATSGGDGLITMTALGEINLDLSADATEALAATMSVAGVINGVLRGNLIATDPDGNPYWRGRAVAEIARSVTA